MAYGFDTRRVAQLCTVHIEQSLNEHVILSPDKTPFPFGQAGHTCCLGEATATSIIAVGTQAWAQQNAAESQAKPIRIDLQCQDPEVEPQHSLQQSRPTTSESLTVLDSVTNL